MEQGFEILEKLRVAAYNNAKAQKQVAVASLMYNNAIELMQGVKKNKYLHKKNSSHT